MNENDYEMLDNAFYIGEGDIDKEKLIKALFIKYMYYIVKN